MRPGRRLGQALLGGVLLCSTGCVQVALGIVLATSDDGGSSGGSGSGFGSGGAPPPPPSPGPPAPPPPNGLQPPPPGTPSPPYAPTSLHTLSVGPGGVSLAWTDNAGNETGFRVERRPSGGSYALVGSVGADTTSFADPGAPFDAQLQYRVVAWNGIGDSAPSNELAVLTVPAAPANLAATWTGPDRVALAWSDQSSSETGFRVERRAGAGAFASLGTVGAGVVAFTDTAAPHGPVDYRVVAVNASGDSAPSGLATVTLPSTAPVLTGLSRRYALEAGGVPVTLTGRYFLDPGAGAVSVRFGRQLAASVVVVNETTLTCTVPASDLTAGPFVDVTVQDALGSDTLPLAFTYGTSLLEEDFSGATLPAWLEDPSGVHVIQNGVLRETASGDGNRRYVRTTSADLLTRDFVFEVTLNVAADSGVAIMFPGIGSGEPDGSFSNEPRESVNYRCHPPNIISGQNPVGAHSVGSFVFTDYRVDGYVPNFGTRRVRITKVGRRATFAIDVAWAAGQPFSADLLTVFEDLSASAPFLTNANTRGFFGGATPACSYDDVLLATLRTQAVRVDTATATDPALAGGTAAALTGTGFTGGGTPQVWFGDASGTPASGVTVADDANLSCTTPAGARSGRTNTIVANALGTGVGLATWRYQRHEFEALFEGTNLDPDLEGRFPVYGGAAHPNSRFREYARTAYADFQQRDFVFEVEVTTTGSDVLYVGLGSGEADAANSNEPTQGVYFRWNTPGIAGGRVDVTVTGAGGSGGMTNVGSIPAAGRHLARLTKRGARLDLQIDAQWPGSGFTPDITYTIPDLTVAAPFLFAAGARGHLFFGGQDGNQRFEAVHARP